MFTHSASDELSELDGLALLPVRHLEVVRGSGRGLEDGAGDEADLVAVRVRDDAYPDRLEFSS